MKKTVDKNKCNWLTKENNDQELNARAYLYRSVRAVTLFTKQQGIPMPSMGRRGEHRQSSVFLCLQDRVFRLVWGERDCVGLERLLFISYFTPAQIPLTTAAFQRCFGFTPWLISEIQCSNFWLMVSFLGEIEANTTLCCRHSVILEH